MFSSAIGYKIDPPVCLGFGLVFGMGFDLEFSCEFDFQFDPGAGLEFGQGGYSMNKDSDWESVRELVVDTRASIWPSVRDAVRDAVFVPVVKSVWHSTMDPVWAEAWGTAHE